MAEAPLIVVVEDEEHLAQGVLFNLQAEGYRTHHEADGDAALEYLLHTQETVDLVLLDGMLPGTDGFDIVRALRQAKRYIAVLMLTARSRPEEVLEGLNAGADDYLSKPFDLGILLARVKSLLRRTEWLRQAEPQQPRPVPTPTSEYHFNHRAINFDLLELVAPNRTTQLTVMEADLLRYLTEREGQIVSRKEILEQVWRMHEDTDTRAVDNFIVRLRRYIEDDPSAPQHLVTVRGIGYRFIANP